MQNYQQFIDPVIQTVLGVLASVLVAVILGLGKRFTRWIDSKTTVAEREQLHHFAAEGVAISATVFKDHDGPQRLQKALDYINTNFAGVHRFTVDELLGAVQKAYLDYKAKTTQPTPAEPVKVEVPVPQPLDPAVQQLVDAAKALQTSQAPPAQPAVANTSTTNA